jgi:uncharacterized protein
MQITRERNSPITVRHVEPGELRVGDEVVRHNVVLAVDSDIREWTAPDVEHLVESDFADLFDSELETILLGTGWKPVFPPRQLVFALARRGIGFESMTTPAACHTFNILLNEGRRAAAVLIVNDP